MHRSSSIAMTSSPTLVGLLLVSLCGACSHTDRMKPTLDAYTRGEYVKALEVYQPLLRDREDSEKDRTLYDLEGGVIAMAAGDRAASMKLFEDAYSRMRPYLDEKAEIRISAEAAAILTNQSVIPYVGTTYDRIMESTYQALNYYAAGEPSKAGVELRRAYAWQQDAVEKRSDEIKALQESAAQTARSNSFDPSSTLKDPAFNGALANANATSLAMVGYTNFAIPYASWLEGVAGFASNQNSGIAQGKVAFDRVVGMLPESARSMVAQDAKLAADALEGAALPPLVMAVYETGRGPSLTEFKIQIPLFIRQVPYVGAAFPVLTMHPAYSAGFNLDAEGGTSVAAVLLTDMDAVVAEEFNLKLPAIITKTIISSGIKATATFFAQNAAGKQNSDAAIFMALAGAIYQVATNSADLRIWNTLPKRVLYARMERPVSGRVTLLGADGVRIGPIECIPNGITLIHVRTPAPGVPAASQTIHIPYPNWVAPSTSADAGNSSRAQPATALIPH